MMNDVSSQFTVLRGDVNGDRAVNFDDLLVVAQNYGQSSRRWSSGDFTYDGAVDFDDLLILAQAYNTSLLQGAAAQGGTQGTRRQMLWSDELIR